MKKLALIGIVVGALVLGACSSSSADSKYCKQFISSSADLENFNAQDPASVQSAIDELKKLEAIAPEATKGDLAVMITNFEALKAGNLAAFDSAAVATAGTNIDDYAVENCNIKIENR